MIQDGLLKIGDFGSAEYLAKKELSGQYSIEGFSKWYMAPEMLFGCRNYETQVDIWSFACIYAEILMGLPIFPGNLSIFDYARIWGN